MAKTRWLVLVALCMASLHAPARAGLEPVNPCRSATATAVAGADYLDVTYCVRLSNPTSRPADVTLLVHAGILEKVEGVTGDLVVNRVGSALVASVPPGWEGQLVIRTKDPIAAAGAPGWLKAGVALPPAVSRYMDFDLPGRSVKLEFPNSGPGRYPIISALPAEGERSRFRVVPLDGDLFVPMWAALPEARPAGYSLRETHRITEDVPAYADDVTLEFTFPGALPASVQAQVPAGVAISSVKISDGAPWKIADGALQITLPDKLSGAALTVQCRLEGAAQAQGPTAQLLAAPLFASPAAERHTGAVYVNGGRHELAFAALEGARQTAAEGWRLACEFQGAAVRVEVRVVPMPVRRAATVETHYAVSEYRVVGTHHVALAIENAPAAALTLLLPPGHTARAVTGDVRDWSQEGGAVRIELAPKPGAVPQVQVSTESLTGGRLQLSLAPPTVEGATSSEYSMAVTHAPEVLLKTAQAEAPWRVTPQALPAWLGQLAPPIAYHYRDAAPTVELEALPVEADLRGTVQDHVTVSADRLQRDTLFLIDIQKRAVQSVDVLLPAGLTAESVEGPYVESWDVAPAQADGSRVTVRFPGPLAGGIHFRLVSSRPAESGNISLRGIGLAGAPALHGWLGIGTDVSTRVLPLEDGHTNLASVRTDQAPAYLKGFDNRLVYEFYSTDWQLDLTAERVPAVYDAEVLNVLSFSASGVEATAFVNVKVAEGGLGEVELHVPAESATPQVDASDVVMTRWSGGVGLVRFRGPRTGDFTLRVDYVLPTGSATAGLNVEPVRVSGAHSQSGVLLLVQAGPEVDVKAQQPPRALQPAEALEQYPDWSYRREHPALAAYGYRDADWRLPVTVTTHPLSEQMLQAIIPVASLDTLVQDGGETLNHLRLFVTNTNQQFLTVDLAKLDAKARLIGTYVYGEPVKPFRRGKTVLELPLFASEKAAQVGMSAIDIWYASPTSALSTLSRRSLGLPDLGLNVGKVEWTVRLPRDWRLTDVGGNLDKPVSGPPPVRGLAERLVRFVWQDARGLLALCLFGVCVAALVLMLRFLSHLLKRPVWPVVWRAALVILILAILASMLMPALSRPRMAAKLSREVSNLHNIGLALAMYAGDHSETYPVDLDVLKGEYVHDPSVFKTPSDDNAELVYRRPGPNAQPTDPVAYFLVPGREGATVLFRDDTVIWVPADSHGDLMNPRAQGRIDVIPPEGTTTLATAPVPSKAFGGQGVGTEELAEALQMQQKMAAASVATANQPVDMGRLNQALIAANRDKIQQAKDAYAKEHGGQQPTSQDEVLAYVSDARLRQALRDEAELMPALERARRGVLAPQMAQQEVQVSEQDRKAEEGQLARSRYSLGNAYMQRGDYDAAEKQFSDALKLDASNEEARRGLDQLRALRSELKAQAEAQVAKGAPAAAAPARAKAAGDLEAVAEQIQQQEEAYNYPRQMSAWAAQPSVGGAGGYGGRQTAMQGFAAPAAPPGLAIAQEELPVMQPRLGKASLVQQVSGGRSIGALPITIDFPTPATVDYAFAKPFLGRAEATLSFRVLRTGSVMLLELVLAAAALLGYGLVRRKAAAASQAGAGYAAVVLVISIAALAAAPATYASAFGAAALAMGACLAAEVIQLTILHIHAMRTGS